MERIFLFFPLFTPNVDAWNASAATFQYFYKQCPPLLLLLSFYSPSPSPVKVVVSGCLGCSRTPTPGTLRQKMVWFIISFLLAMAATR